MKVPYNWLKSYIDFPYSPQELAYKLTMAGLEVEGLEYLGEGIENIVIGEIEEIEEHPNADKLVICNVNIGEETLQIITGAPNVFEGAKIPVATIGVTLPGGMEIKKTKLRGEPSYGMMCSEDELGLIDERADGIMILDDSVEAGEKFVKYMGLDEYVLKLDLTPNYARCLGMIGIAREIKAMLDGEEINYPDFDLKTNDEDINEYIQVEIEDDDLCHRYTGRLIKNVKIGPSPLWMQHRLRAAGIRPISNIVDITNYVLLEYNQPLHAFDYDQIAKQKIIVRRAEEEEKVVTLDDKERELSGDVLLISDPDKAVGLAGVMGGANSEVTDETVNIFLESAYFKPENIRQTARKLGLPSEASHRFERGVDIENLIEASNRAAYLMQEYAEGEVVGGIIDEAPHPFEELKIDLKVDRVNELLGIDVAIDKMKEMLERLEFGVEIVSENILRVSVPSYRNDVELAADLVEEVARMYGYNKIPITNNPSKQRGRRTVQQKVSDQIKDIMASSGLDEILTFSLMDKEIYDKINIPDNDRLRKWVKIKNPLNEAFSIMRTSLIPEMIRVLSNNAKRQLNELAFFEIGKTFLNQGNNERPLESFMLAGGSMGYPEDIWNNNAADFFFLKGVVENLFNQLHLDDIEFSENNISYLHPGRTASIVYRNEEIGFIGELAPEIIDDFDLDQGTTVFQINLSMIIEDADYSKFEYAILPKHPAVSRDLALVVDKDIPAGQILTLIKDVGSKLLKKVSLFDIYQGDQIPENSKSLAFQLKFQASDRTLTDEEVNEVFEAVVSKVNKEFDAEIRGN